MDLDTIYFARRRGRAQRVNERLDIRLAARAMRALRFLGRWARDITIFAGLVIVLLACMIFDVEWL